VSPTHLGPCGTSLGPSTLIYSNIWAHLAARTSNLVALGALRRTHIDHVGGSRDAYTLDLHAVSSIRALVGAINGVEPRWLGLCVKLRLRLCGGRTAFRPVLAFGVPGGPRTAMSRASRDTCNLDLHAVFCIPALEGTLKGPEPACFGICDKLRARQGGPKTASRPVPGHSHLEPFQKVTASRNTQTS